MTTRYDYRKLRGRIVEMFGTMDSFCDRINRNRSLVSQKMNNKSEFTQTDIDTFCAALKIESVEIPDYFFKHEC